MHTSRRAFLTLSILLLVAGVSFTALMQLTPAWAQTSAVAPAPGTNVISKAAKSSGASVFMRDPNCLNLVGMYPLPGEKPAQQVVLYFSEPIVCPKLSDGRDKAPIKLEPWEAKTEFKVKDNYISLGFGPEVLKLPVAFIRIAVDPELRGVSGKPLNPAIQPIVVPINGQEANFLYTGGCLSENTITVEMTAPVARSQITA